MTEKELRHLNRHDLLQLLLMQSREVERLQAALTAAEAEAAANREEVSRERQASAQKEEQLGQFLHQLDGMDGKLDKLLARTTTGGSAGGGFPEGQPDSDGCVPSLWPGQGDAL